MSKFRNIVFTINNPTDEDLHTLKSSDIFSYIIFGHEKGTEGTPHLQGYAELKKQQRRKRILKAMPRAFIDRRRGSQKQAIAYCKKEGHFEEKGMPREQGKRKDLTLLRELSKTVPFNQLAWECDNFQQFCLIKGLCSLKEPTHEYRKRKCVWLYGSTGSGKTRRAMEECPAADTWHASTGQWFDNYYGQSYVIIDELRAKNWPYDLLLSLLDGYDKRVPIKGGFTVWRPHTVYITTPLSPEATFAGQLQFHGSIAQLLRRLTEVCDMDASPLYK